MRKALLLATAAMLTMTSFAAAAEIKNQESRAAGRQGEVGVRDSV
jgi:hypothetical protein